MDYIKSFTEQDLCKLILETKESLYICLPLLQPEVMNAIDQLDFEQSNTVSINIGLDFSPETFRQGYGEIESFELIERTGYNVLNFKDNRVSFVISDNIGYFLFFESRYFIPANKSTLNAVNIDPISIIRLKQHFFDLYKSEAEYKNEIANSFVDETVKLNNIHQEYSNKPVIEKSPIDEKTFQEVSKDLQENPPLKPDYQRIVNYYKNKYQYVRFEYKGANLKSKKIEIPPKILPIKNTTFKKNLETKLNLFSNQDKDTFKDFEEMNSRIKKIREKFLKSLSSRKENILKLSEKELFVSEIETLKKELENLTKNNLKLISSEINKTKEEIKIQLRDFFLQYKEEFPSYNSLFGTADADYVLSEIDGYVDKVISNIKWPAAHQLFENFELNVFYSDITYEDLNNKELIKELKDKMLFSDEDDTLLAEFGIGIRIEK